MHVVESLIVDKIELSPDKRGRVANAQGVNFILENRQPENLLVVGDMITWGRFSSDEVRIVEIKRNVEMHSGGTDWKRIWPEKA